MVRVGKMSHLMLDLETLGVSTEAPLISIGAIFFDLSSGTQYAEFYRVVHLSSALEFGQPEPATLQWWMKQSDEARSVFNEPDSLSMKTILVEFSDFIKRFGDENVKVWGNGSSFDNAILASAYRKQSIDLPWDFRNDRDVRTIIDLAKELKNFDARAAIKMNEYAHHALHDAKYQAAYVSAAYQALKTM